MPIALIIACVFFLGRDSFVSAQVGQPPAEAQNYRPPQTRDVAFDQLLGAQVPPELEFRDEHNRPVRLSDYFGDRPVILVLAYYRCPMLCTQVLNGLVDGLRRVSFNAGSDFRVVVVSFDAREKPALARAKKTSYVESYGRPGADAGWSFLTGAQPAINALTKAVGFRYQYDAARDQFAHASGILVLTPRGQIARYFYGIHYLPRDLRLALVEASAQKIGTTVDQLMLICFHYDTATGKYAAAVKNLVRLGGLLTVGILAVVLVRAWRRGPQPSRQQLATE